MQTVMQAVLMSMPSKHMCKRTLAKVQHTKVKQAHVQVLMQVKRMGYGEGFR